LRFLAFGVQHPSEKNFVQRMIISDLMAPASIESSLKQPGDRSIGLENQFLALLQIHATTKDDGA